MAVHLATLSSSGSSRASHTYPQQQCSRHSPSLGLVSTEGCPLFNRVQQGPCDIFTPSHALSPLRTVRTATSHPRVCRVRAPLFRIIPTATGVDFDQKRSCRKPRSVRRGWVVVSDAAAGSCATRIAVYIIDGSATGRKQAREIHFSSVKACLYNGVGGAASLRQVVA